jgi:hypothetical protein
MLRASAQLLIFQRFTARASNTRPTRQIRWAEANMAAMNAAANKRYSNAAP